MEKSILIAGFGGQGVQTLGKLLTYTANENELYVSFYPSYGAEMRGGTSNCTVVISDTEIAAPYRNSVDCVVALNAPSYKAFFKSVKAGGTFIMNSNLVEVTEEAKDVNVIGIPLNDMANALRSPMTLNVIMLGFLSVFMDGLTPESAEAIVTKILGKRKNMLAMNLKAFYAGVDFARNTGQ